MAEIGPSPFCASFADPAQYLNLAVVERGVHGHESLHHCINSWRSNNESRSEKTLFHPSEQ